jgi:hypothetical protein
MSRPNSILFALYRHALRLYPSRLRLLYQDQMLQTARDAHAERQHRPFFFWSRLFTDLCTSSVKEHILMTRDEAMRRPIFFHALTLCVLFTLWGFSAAITMQQLLRRGADQPQIQMAQNYASTIASMPNPAANPNSPAASPTASVASAFASAQAKRMQAHGDAFLGRPGSYPLPAGHIDLATSLEPFVILYNSDGAPIHSTGYLDDAVPIPPHGVFAYLRTQPIDKFTWQPRPGLRIAAVAQRIDGPTPGFILVGRSLTLVQQQEDRLRVGTFITWFCLMALLIAGAVFLNRAQTRQVPAS